MSDLRRKNGRAAPWKIPFVGVGNESWGCGGNMTSGILFGQFSAVTNEFVKNYPGNKIYRIASGANSWDTNWTEVLMRKAGEGMNGCRCITTRCPAATGRTKVPPHQFTEAEWFNTLRGALDMDALIAQHTAIMDRYDPKKRIGLMVERMGRVV